MRLPTSYDVAKELVREGNTVTFLRKILYPVLEVKARIQEKAREQMADIEQAILKLVGLGVSTPESLAQLLGLALHRIRPLLIELEGRSLIARDSANNIKLANLGYMSLSLGAAVIEVERSLLLCGITGQLLPRGAYNIPRLPLDTLYKHINHCTLVEPATAIPLSALNITNNRSVNLADEVVAIINITTTSACFLESICAVYHDRLGHERVEVRLSQKESINWIKRQQVLPFIEPLGYMLNESPIEILANVQVEIHELGATLFDKGDYYESTGIVLELEQLGPTLEKRLYDKRSWILCVGTDQYPPIPITEFSFEYKDSRKEDILQGNPLILLARSTDLIKKVNFLRFIEETLDNYYKIPKSQQNTSLKVYLEEHLKTQGSSLKEALSLVQQIGDRRLLWSLEN